MVKIDTLDRFGEHLRKGEASVFTVTQLTKMLMKWTGSFHKTTLRRYVEILKERGYIKFKDGRWEVVRINKSIFDSAVDSFQKGYDSLVK